MPSLDLPGDKVDFKGQVVLLFLKGAGIKGRILDGPEGFNDALPVGEYFVGGTHESDFDLVIRKGAVWCISCRHQICVVALPDHLPVLAG